MKGPFFLPYIIYKALFRRCHLPFLSRGFSLPLSGEGSGNPLGWCHVSLQGAGHPGAGEGLVPVLSWYHPPEIPFFAGFRGSPRVFRNPGGENRPCGFPLSRGSGIVFGFSWPRMSCHHGVPVSRPGFRPGFRGPRRGNRSWRVSVTLERVSWFCPGKGKDETFELFVDDCVWALYTYIYGPFK